MIVYIVRGNRIVANWSFTRKDNARNFNREYVARRCAGERILRIDARVRAGSF